MGAMKDFDTRIRQGGDDAIAAVSEYVAEQERLVAQVESMLQRACDRHWKEWISVEERLPEESVEVLSFAYGRRFNAEWWRGEWWHACQGFESRVGRILMRVTHWMPLPEPPEVK